MTDILVVGGGSAGWITACYLDALLNRKNNKNVNITLVESAIVPKIGVGEATIPNIRGMLSSIGVPEPEFMRESDATFKQAIKFKNWYTNEGESYFHPFDRRAIKPGDSAAHEWLAGDRKNPWASLVSAEAHFCEMGLSPKASGWPDYGSTFPYAYHFDAEKFAHYLCRVATSRGVTRVFDDVTEVEVDERGTIQAVRTGSNNRLAADYFFDCTGFASVLCGKSLDIGWVDYSSNLLCNSAVTMRVPYDVYYPGRIKPFTTSTALSSGWSWDIGLSNRRGLGYVYSSDFLSDEDAEEELRSLEGAHSTDLESRILRFRVGRRESFWKSNCVAIGLSAGFIEPLESTALYLIETGVRLFCDNFSENPDAIPVLRRQYNHQLANLYEEILEFIILHYYLSKRRDSEFWRAATSPSVLTNRLSETLELLHYKPLEYTDFDRAPRLFSTQSYEFILFGMNLEVELDKLALKTQSLKDMNSEVARIVRLSTDKLPTHEEWLRSQLNIEV